VHPGWHPAAFREGGGGVTRHRRLRSSLLSLSIALCVTGVIIAGVTGSLGAAMVTAAAVGPILIALTLERQYASTPAALLDKMAKQAESGRKLAIYERETGLFAQWYVTLRCDEECQRATRYQRPLALLLVESDVRDGALRSNDEITGWLHRQLRATDLAGYLGNARYLVLMPETKPTQAKRAIKRLVAEVEGSEAGLSCFPEDGGTFEELFAVAQRKLAGRDKAA
jgi:GGDEF domain-containing protein